MKIDKPWGHEFLWACTNKYAGKLLYIDAGKRLSLQHHEKKDETIYIMWGQMDLILDNEKFLMGPGDHKRIKAGQVHRMSAVTDVIIIEVSTPELDDVVRLEDDYGRLDNS